MTAGLAAFLACLTLLGTPASAGRIEAGAFIAHDTLGTNRTPDRVTFQQAFDVPPVVIVMVSSNGNNSASIQITNVSTTGFDELIVEPDNWDGRHLAMVTYYIAVEPGRHVLPDGTVIEAGRTNIGNIQFGTGFVGGTRSWGTINFSAPLASTPTVIHQLQSANSETNNPAQGPSRPHITSIAQNPSTSGFQIAIDRSQANSGPSPATEVVGWIAWPTGSNGSFPAIDSSTIDWSTRTSGATIRGWDNGCFNAAHGNPGGTPIAVAKKLSRNNQDGGWIRYCSINGTNVSIRVDEDRDQDNERSISSAEAEQVGIVAFSTSFHALLEADLAITKSRIAIDDGRGGDFAIPGASVDYRITVSNSGNSPPNRNSVRVIESLPNDLVLLLVDYGTPGSGPVAFQQGTPTSSLTCGFTSFASTTDCYDFSTDGVDFNYVPTDSGDGTDPAVRFLRAIPSGFMAADNGGGSPSFELRLRTRIR